MAARGHRQHPMAGGHPRHQGADVGNSLTKAFDYVRGRLLDRLAGLGEYFWEQVVRPRDAPAAGRRTCPAAAAAAGNCDA
jgi:hypothetical protein